MGTSGSPCRVVAALQSQGARVALTASTGIAGRGLHSFTLELNLSNCRTHS
jgi:hypothetical protein